MSPQNHTDSIFGHVMEGNEKLDTLKNVSSTTVSPQNLQTFDMIDFGMSNIGATSTGMTFQIIHLFLLKISII